MSEAKRAYFYRIALAVMAALAAYGLITVDQLPVWLNVLGAVFGIGSAALATKNTSTHRDS